jgi:iron complex transport system substrate-binding protein
MIPPLRAVLQPRLRFPARVAVLLTLFCRAFLPVKNSISESRQFAHAPLLASAGARLAASIVIGVLCAVAARAQAGAPADGPSSQIEVTDELGRTIKVPQPVRRIVSLAPNLTETVFALDAGDRVVGDTDVDDFPVAAKAIPHVGDVLAPSLEEIVALHPDLVLATNDLNRRETVEALDRLGFAVYVTHPLSIADVLNSTAAISRLIGAGERGDAAVAGMRARLDDLAQRLAAVPPSRVLFVVWTQPLTSIGTHTFLAEALAHAGAQSVVDIADGWPKISIEYALKLQPEYLVFAGSLAEANAPPIEELSKLPGWRDLDAVRNGKIVIVSDAIDRPAPRMVDAIEELAHLLHPGVFAPTTPAGGASLLAPGYRGDCTEVLTACAR